MPTAYETYQMYLKGPAVLIRLFEQTLGTEVIYGPPPPDLAGVFSVGRSPCTVIDCRFPIGSGANSRYRTR